MFEVIETLWIPMRDGTKLAARLWLPNTAREKPIPAILEYIPYRRRDKTRLRDEGMHPHFATHDYASIRVDMRGSGDSEGVMLDEYADIETQDGVDVIAWIAAQDWCNGRVGMFGKSWGAYNSFQVAAKRPPALQAIAPVMGTDDRWLEDIHFYGGVLANDNFWWGSIMQLYNAYPPDPAIVGDRWRDMWKERLDAMTYWPAQWLQHQTHDAMWRRGSISENYDDINIPVYFFGGWADLFRDTPFRIAQFLKSPVKILMGPWAHLYPHDGIPNPKGDFLTEVTRFWDHYLKDINTGLMDEPRYRFYLQDSVKPAGTHKQRLGTWVEESHWPTPNTQLTTYFLNQQTLQSTPQTGTTLSITSPQTFGSAAGDMCSFAIPGDMPVDCRIDAAGALSFRSDPLSAPMAILGQASLTLNIAVDKPQAFVAALLIDEAETGEQTLITRGFANLMHRHSDSEPQTLESGELVSLTVPFHGIGFQIAEGHRLVLQIASSYWPVLWPSPEPVKISIETGRSVLELPSYTTNGHASQTSEVTTTKPKHNMSIVKKGSMERSLTEDLSTGDLVARFFVDGGVFGPVGTIRLNDIGTEMNEISDRIYRIHPDDPLSATAIMNQEGSMHRDDWSIKIKTTAKMTSSKSLFYLSATVDCWDGDTHFHTVEWTHEIPRRGM